MSILNPALDVKQLAKDFAVDRRLRIDGILRADKAEDFARTVEGDVAWKTFFNVGGKNFAVTPQELLSIDPEEQQKLQADMINHARQGEGFIYQGCHLPRDDGSVLADILAEINSDAVLNFIRELTNDNEITHADGQCTQYLPGHFLTRHQDILESEQRRYAYVINLSRQWHPDWGGLLQFFEPDGTPRDSWSPGFNVLSIFATPHIHSVTYVTPFAGNPRNAITGWFRSGQIQKQAQQ